MTMMAFGDSSRIDCAPHSPGRRSALQSLGVGLSIHTNGHVATWPGGRVTLWSHACCPSTISTHQNSHRGPGCG